ncbi:MAG: NDP-sugar synthase [Methanobacterium sp. ERen5]|nr:MAG: NDP-sugar synthase [Methanobacterium sp. ERen5]
MAGGQGTRLRPLTFIRPKPMIPLVNKPIMEHIMERLKQYHFKDLILTLNYLSSDIMSYFKDGSNKDLNITYSVEKSPLGTAGSVKKAEKYLDETFMVLSGDVVSDINFSEVLKFHKDKGALATLVVTTVKDPSHFGIAEFDDDMKITKYLEKPAPQEAFSNMANTGTYILEPEIFEYFDGLSGEVDFSRDIFPQLISEDAGIYGYIFDGYWNDVGRPETYLNATYDVLSQKIKQKIYPKSLKEDVGKLGNIWMGKNITIGPRVRIEGPVVLGSNCTIGEGCTLSKGTVIGESVTVGNGTTIQSSVILANTAVHSNSFLKGCIVDTDCEIEKNTIIEEGVVTGSNVKIGKNSIIKSASTIKNGSIILPYSVIDAQYEG